jgi:hypothetical protein
LVAAAAAIIILALGAFLYQRAHAPTRSAPSQAAIPDSTLMVASVPLQTIATDQDDEQLLSQVQAARPAAHDTYAATLKQVNASIADAKKSLEQNPDDDDAHQSLVKAYEQKAMLYDMALRSLQ